MQQEDQQHTQQQPGQWAIVELFGHQKIAWRIGEHALGYSTRYDRATQRFEFTRL